MKELNAAEIQDVNGGSVAVAVLIGILVGYLMRP